MSLDDRRLRRVVSSHRIAAAAFWLAGAFGLIAAVWAVWVALRGGSWWGPLHAFLAGVVVLAISGATQMFTYTWAAAPPPKPALASAQRWAVASGVVLVLSGVTLTNRWAAGLGVLLLIAGLIVLAVSLYSAVQHSLLRRFDLSARFYLLGIGSAVVGVSLGGVMGVGATGASHATIRLVHSHLTLVGFVGLTIVGTLPTILPTFAHHKAVSGLEARIAWWLAAGSVAAMVSGLAFGAPAVAAGTIAAGMSLLLILIGVLARLGRRGFQGGLAYIQVTLGAMWLALWGFVDGATLALGEIRVPFSRWTAVAVVAGVAQVLLGSLAYLLPVLAGPAPRLGRNLRTTHRRPAVPLAAANAAGLAFALGVPTVGAVLAPIWAIDFLIRLAKLERGDARPTPDATRS